MASGVGSYQWELSFTSGVTNAGMLGQEETG
jgi:hypothetical protein